jgi:predicted HTH domain antitoxin
MAVIHVDCPEEVLLSLHETASEFQQELRLAAAMKLYELGRLSSGRAAELAGLPRVLFLQRTGEFKVSVFQQTPEEIESDLKNA